MGSLNIKAQLELYLSLIANRKMLNLVDIILVFSKSPRRILHFVSYLEHIGVSYLHKLTNFVQERHLFKFKNIFFM